jgi:hypothetical protein
MRKLTSILAAVAMLTAMSVAQAKPKAPAPADPTVYCTDAGKAYHKKNCKLKTGSKGMKLSVAKKKGYKACKVCKPAA